MSEQMEIFWEEAKQIKQVQSFEARAFLLFEEPWGQNGWNETDKEEKVRSFVIYFTRVHF